MFIFLLTINEYNNVIILKLRYSGTVFIHNTFMYIHITISVLLKFLW